MTQLELALCSGISSRHISFIENDRAHPSRAVLLQLTEAMKLTPSQENAVLIAAGYIPNFSDPKMGPAESKPLLKAFEFILRNQHPYPAYAIDRAWNVVLFNEPFRLLIHRILGGAEWHEEPCNIARLLLHPDYLRPHLLNWQATARVLLHRIRSELQVPNPRPETRALLEEIHSYPGMEEALIDEPPAEDFLLVPLRLDVDGTETSWYSIIGSLGFPPEVSTYQLRIEAVFPADDVTDTLMHAIAGPDVKHDSG
jgi:transcriptional regulator with XRE-family HTH domain